MNERIEELAVQAGNYVNETYTGPVPATFTGNSEWHKEFDKWTQFSEKFAELIVRECAEQVEQAKNSPFVSLDDAKRMKHFVDVTKKKIKQHFGVK